MVATIPVLGPAGFTTDINIKADEALANFYISQRSQSDLYRHSTSSLGSLVAAYGNDAITMEREVKETLDNYLGRQFEQADVTVDAHDLDTGGFELRISVILRDGDTALDIRHMVETEESKIKSIIDLQNHGKPFIHADLFGN